MKYYYTYTILFVDGYYYYGKRTSKVPPEQDTKYNGSPRKNKDKWKTTEFIKVIEEVYNSPEELILAEYNLIGDKFKTDVFCLNAHNGMKFHNINGTPHTNSSRQAISNALTGKERSQKHRENLSKARKKYFEENYEKNPMFDPVARKNWEEKIQSEEYKLKQLQSSYRRKEIYVDGVLYLSINDACKKTGIQYYYLEMKSKETNYILTEDYNAWNANKNSTQKIKVEIDGIVYPSMAKASKETKIPIVYIKKCLGDNKDISLEEYLKYKHNLKKKEKVIVKKTGRKIKVTINEVEYESIREASRKTGIPRSFIKKYYT